MLHRAINATLLVLIDGRLLLKAKLLSLSPGQTTLLRYKHWKEILDTRTAGSDPRACVERYARAVRHITPSWLSEATKTFVLASEHRITLQAVLEEADRSRSVLHPEEVLRRVYAAELRTR